MTRRIVKGLTGFIATVAAGLVMAGAPATNFRTLFSAAIDAPDGLVKTEVHGPLLRKIQSDIHTNARIFVEVKVIQVLLQPGCKRLKVTFSAPESRLPTMDGGVAPLDGVGFDLNMCRDGNPPGVITAN